MPIRTERPPTPVRASAENMAKKVEAARTSAVFRNLLLVLAVAHFVVVVILAQQGLGGYLDSWLAAGRLLIEKPLYAGFLPAALLLIYKGVELWRNSEPEEVQLPPFPPMPDLRFNNSLHIGSAWSREGLQPGDVYRLDDEDELFDPDDVHVVIEEKGLFGNIHCTGGVGSGKTSTLIQPVIWQAVSKYPRPPVAPPDNGKRHRGNSASRLKDLLGDDAVDERKNARAKRFLEWDPYEGMSTEEAEAEFTRLMELHKDKKWGMFVMDPKGDLTEFVLRVAAMADRSEDVVVLRPDGESTYNPLVINANPGVQAELVMDGIEAVSGQPIQQYWRGTMAEWLENALALLKVVDPTRITFRNVLRLARNESLRTHMVSEAEAIMRQAQEDEERLRRLGKTYNGVRVDPAAIEFFRDWDDEEADPQLKRAVVSGIKTQSKYFVNSELAPFLCPEMPATFNGFEAMIDEGKIVVLRMPLDIYGPVARVLGILVMADAQQAARARINRMDLNQDRVVLFCIDEISSYLNKSTRDFIAMNRQSRVCFLAAHQTQGQLVQHGDRGFQDSFKDNLRTKIAFSTPNADAARKEASIMGSRQVYKEVVTESHSFRAVERIEADAIAPASPEAASASVRMDEVDRLWFAPEKFMELRLGECIVMQFDGETTVPPRRVQAPAFFRSPLQKVANEQDIDLRVRSPHPVVSVAGEDRDEEYIGSALVQTGYVIVEPLANHELELEGFKLVTDVGTLIVSCDLLEELEHAIADRMTDPQILVVFTDLENGAVFFSGHLGFQFERVLGLPEAFAATGEAAPSGSFADIFSEMLQEELSYTVRGSWDYHRDLESNRKQVLRDSRNTIRLFTALGDRLHDLSEESLDALYDDTRDRIAEILSPDDPGPEPGSAPDDGPEDISPDTGPAPMADLEPTPQGSTDQPTAPLPDDFQGYFEEEDPFAHDTFPEDLLAPEGDRSPPATEADPAPQSGPDGSETRFPRAPRRSEKQDRDDMLSLFPGGAGEPVDAGGSEADLLSIEFPTDIAEALGNVDDAASTDEESTTGAPEPKGDSGIRRKTRRRDSGPDRGSAGAGDSQGTLDLGLPADTPSRSSDGERGTSDDDGDSDLTGGAPID